MGRQGNPRFVWLLYTVALCASVFSGGSWGQTLSAEPVFALNTQSHTGFALHLSLSPDERQVITAGYDKTVRVWDVQTGQLVRRFYLPVRDPEDGAIEVISLSPDGERLAIGGSIQGFGPGRSVLVMSMRNGRVLKTISNFSLNARAMNWSKDGNFLAVGTDGRESSSRIHVFDTRTWKKVFEERDVKGRVEIIEFRRDGRFFAATFNGAIDSEVFLYKPEGDSFSRIKKLSLGKRATYRGSWTADETHFYINGHSYFNGEDMTEPGWVKPGARPIRDGFNQLKESPDGGVVFAGFRAKTGKTGKFRRYDDKSLRTFTDLEIPDPRISDFVVLKNGSVVYLAEDGAVAALGADFKPLWRNASPSASFGGTPETLKVSADGKWVTIPLNADAKGDRDAPKALAFNLYQPGFARLTAIKQAWTEPLTSRREMALLAWSGTTNGSINGVDLPKIHGRERALSAAVHSTEAALVYGSASARLHKVTGEGKSLWTRYLAADVTAVTLIEASNLVVAATEDGFLRVLRWEDGATVMTYYLQPGERKWLALANSGHYQASVGAEDLAGWIVNRDQKHMADFFPMSRFRNRFALPGVAAAVLKERDSAAGARVALEAKAVAMNQNAELQAQLVREEEARIAEAKRRAEVALKERLAQAEREAAGDTIGEALRVGALATENDAVTDLVTPAKLSMKELASGGAPLQPLAPNVEQLPPVIDILSPGLDVTSSDRMMTVRYRVRSPEGVPVTHVQGRVMAAHQVARALMPKAVAGGERELTVDLPAEDAEIQLVAENRWGPSMPVSIKVKYTGEKPKAAPEKPVLHLLAVGVSEYDNPKYKLGLAAKDATDFGKLLSAQSGKFYERVELTTLTDKKAGKAAVESALAALQAKVRPQDTTFVFLAGHGINDGAGEYLYLPREADLSRLKETGVSFRLLRQTLAGLPGRTLMFVDTCHAGNALGESLKAGARDNTTAINELAAVENNIIVFASSTGAQESLEMAEWGNGAFTKALVEGFLGAADTRKRGRITYKQLDAYVSDRVDELTQGRQTPVTPVLVTVPDFALAEVGK